MNKLTRRTLLASTGTALGAAALAPNWLTKLLAHADGADKGLNLVVVMAYGGWDGTVFDPNGFGSANVDMYGGVDVLTRTYRPGVPQTFGNLRINVDPARPSVSYFFAQHGGDTAVVLGIQTGSLDHLQCSIRTMTGTTDPRSGDMCAIFAQEYGRENTVPYLSLASQTKPGKYASLATSNGRVNQIAALLSPANAPPPGDNTPYHAGNPNLSFTAPEKQLINDFLAKRKAALEQSTAGQTPAGQSQLGAWQTARGRAGALVDSPQLVAAYGAPNRPLTAAQEFALATQALKSGLTRTVCIDTVGWDTHLQMQYQNPLFENLFGPLTTFVTGLKNIPGKTQGKTLFQETVIVVLSEMVRTPKINGAIPVPILGETDNQWLLRIPGKDHWFHTNALILGGGVSGNRTIGGTDANQKAKLVVMEDGSIDADGSRGGLSLTHTNLIAGIMHHLGVDYARYLPAKPLVLA